MRQLRYGTAAEWTSANVTLRTGEVGFETDTGKTKIGDGISTWAALAYTVATPLAHATSHELGGSDPVTANLADVTGTLAVANGGTGQTAQQTAINALTNVAAATNEHVLTKDTGTGNATFKAVPAQQAFPVGAVFIGVVSTNPGTLLGYGTWSAFGAGRVLVGLNAADADFDTVEETGGAKAVASVGTNTTPTISGNTAAEASHTHTVTVSSHVAGEETYGIDSGVQVLDAPGGVVTHSPATSSAGSPHSHGVGTLAATAPAFTGTTTSVVQPYIVCYFWKRTA